MLSLISPAKVNLSLSVLSKREDGYHELETLLEVVDLCDRLTFELSDEDEILSKNPYFPLDSSNLISKSIDLFRKKTGYCFHIRTYVEKNIPMKAGLGGGSSNAATTLWALNQILKTNIEEKTLQEWSSEIGSDIPFFFSLGSAICHGRGEKVTNQKSALKGPLLILKPNHVSLSTKMVFERLGKEMMGKVSFFENSLEEPAFQIAPELALLKEQLLKQGFQKVVMTGSGSAFVAASEKKEIEIKNCFVYWVKGLQRTADAWYQ